MELKDLLSPEQKRTTEILLVSVDGREDLQRMVDRISAEDGVVPEDLVFLSDPGHRVIDRYGLLNPFSDRGIPHPTTFVLDRDGVVRWKFVEENYEVRPTNAMILEALEGLEGLEAPEALEGLEAPEDLEGRETPEPPSGGG